MAPEKASFPDPEREHRAQTAAQASAPAPDSGTPPWLRHGAFAAGLALMGYLAVADTSKLFRAAEPAVPAAEAPLQDPFPGEVRAVAELVSPFEKPGKSSLGMLKTGPADQGIDFTESEVSIAPDPAEPPMAPDGAFGVNAPKGAVEPIHREAFLPGAPGTRPLADRPRLRPFESGASSRVRSWRAPPPGQDGEEAAGETSSAFYQKPADLPAPGAAPVQAQAAAPGPQAPRRSAPRAHAGGRASGPPVDKVLAQIGNVIAGIAGGAQQGQNQQISGNLRAGGEIQVRYRCPNGYWLNSIARTCCPKKEFCERRDPRGTCTQQQAEGGLGR